MNAYESLEGVDPAPGRTRRVMRGIGVAVTTAAGAVLGSLMGFEAGKAFVPDQFHPEDTHLVRTVAEGFGIGVGGVAVAAMAFALAHRAAYGPFKPAVPPNQTNY